MDVGDSLALNVGDSFGVEFRLIPSLGYLISGSMVARQGFQHFAGVEVLIDLITTQH